MVYAHDSKSCSLTGLRVQVPPMAPFTLSICMHELLEAIIHLLDALLIPFNAGSEPKKKWVRIVGLLIGMLGVIALGGLFYVLFFTSGEVL